MPLIWWQVAGLKTHHLLSSKSPVPSIFKSVSEVQSPVSGRARASQLGLISVQFQRSGLSPFLPPFHAPFTVGRQATTQWWPMCTQGWTAEPRCSVTLVVLAILHPLGTGARGLTQQLLTSLRVHMRKTRPTVCSLQMWSHASIQQMFFHIHSVCGTSRDWDCGNVMGPRSSLYGADVVWWRGQREQTVEHLSIYLLFFYPLIYPQTHHTHLSIHSSIHPFIHSTSHLSIYSSIYPFVHPPTHPFIHPPYPSISSPAHPLILLSIHSSLHPFTHHSSTHTSINHLSIRQSIILLHPSANVFCI